MQAIAKIWETLEAHGVQGSLVNSHIGPRITRYDLKLNKGSKVKKVLALQPEMALACKAPYVRISAIPETGIIGIEIPNETPETVDFRRILNTSEWQDSKAYLPLMVGVDVTGQPIVKDLADMPHLLVAGSTGSGKSVALRTMLNGLLTARTPDEMQLVIVDPKRVEFSGYGSVPHLMAPIVTEAEDTVGVLRGLVQEMENRYALLQNRGVRDLVELENLKKETFSRIVVIIDELADLVLSPFGKEIELELVKLAQKSRASGIYLIAATQRPVVKVISGLIKANFPARMAFRVPAAVDSKIVLDTTGAEELLGQGDMLFLAPGYPKPIRVQGAFSDTEMTNQLLENINTIYNVVEAPVLNSLPTSSPKSAWFGREELVRNVCKVVAIMSGIFILTHFI